MYVRRSALDLVGDFDLAFTPGYGEEVDFSQRCLQMALAHVAADEVLVRHHGGASLSANGVPHPAQRAHEAIIDERYPYYRESVTATAAGGARAARALARRRAAGGERPVGTHRRALAARTDDRNSAARSGADRGAGRDRTRAAGCARAARPQRLRPRRPDPGARRGAHQRGGRCGGDAGRHRPPPVTDLDPRGPGPAGPARATA